MIINGSVEDALIKSGYRVPEVHCAELGNAIKSRQPMVIPKRDEPKTYEESDTFNDIFQDCLRELDEKEKKHNGNIQVK